MTDVSNDTKEESMPVDGEDIIDRLQCAIWDVESAMVAYNEPNWVARCAAIIAEIQELLKTVTS